MKTLLVPARFCGPPSSGNGGWTSGALAEFVEGCPTDHGDPWPVVEVSLRLPPPLDTPLSVTTADEVTTASGTAAVAQARRVEGELEPVEAVPADRARAVESSYSGFRRHPFPTCFSCGPERAVGDGLRIFPGKVADTKVAATWTPHPSTAEDFHTYTDGVRRSSVPVTWAALDCVGGWSSDLENRPMVLGRMTAQLDALPVIGEEHVLVGEHRRDEGRKTFTGSTLYDADGRIVARAQHVWIAVDPSTFA